MGREIGTVSRRNSLSPMPKKDHLMRLPRLPRGNRGSGARRKKAAAISPGSLIHVGEQKAERQAIHVIEYDEEHVRTAEAERVSECLPFKSTPAVTWLRVVALHDVENIGELGRLFDVHPLVLEDILNTGGRSKVEAYDDFVFVVTKLVSLDEEAEHLDVQHFAMLLLPNTVITFQEEATAIFDPVIERIRTGSGGRIRKSKADYLAWAILDAVVDNYYDAIDSLDEIVTVIDDQLQEDAASVEVAHLYAVRREVNGFHRLARPLREIAGALERSESRLLPSGSKPFYRDLYDHAIHVIERTEDLRDLAAGLRDFSLAVMSNRMNEVMKVLTCFATIFMPLTFIAGVYGMNFEKMPELKSGWAYPAVWGSFVLIAGGMFVYFRRKKWI